MIFLKNDFIDNSHEYISLIESEKNLIKSMLNIQKETKEIILNYLQNFADSTDLIDIESINCVNNFLDALKESLKICNDNISLLESCINKIEDLISRNNILSPDVLKIFNNKYTSDLQLISENNEIIFSCLSSLSKRSEFTFNNLNYINNNETLPTINDDKATTFTDPISISSSEVPNLNSTNTFETLSNEQPLNSTQAQNTEIDVLSSNESSEDNSSSLNKETELFEEKTEFKENENIFKKSEELKNVEEVPNLKLDDANISNYGENTLLISESSQKIFLPYEISKINELMKKNSAKYSSFEEVIQKRYTLPINKFKNPSLARFKEAFKLMRKREGASVPDAISLGLELMFNYKLHPAIISACKRLDELDIYLDYLERGQTNKFNCFKIIFETAPIISKRKKRFEF